MRPSRRLGGARALSRSSAAIVSAEFAACGGAIQTTSFLDPEPEAGAGAPSPIERATDDEGGGDPFAQPIVDAAREARDLTHCPPPTDPYWDEVFADGGTWGDAAVCGLIVQGICQKTEPRVNGPLLCAMYTHQAGRFGCPTAICERWCGAMGPPCSPHHPSIDGAPAPIFDDAGNCLLDEDASYQANCGLAGRRPHGLARVEASGSSAIGAFFARQAVHEAASIVAFARIANELRAFGAPADLADACELAACEEAEHAAITRDLAARFGGVSAPPRIAAHLERSLEAFAIENAVEGLVNETYAAVIAVHQAAFATDDGVRRAMRRIAGDELSHAELARRIDAWMDRELAPEARARVQAAKHRAVHALRQKLEREAAEAGENSADLTAAGIPGRATALMVCSALEGSVWGRA